MCQDSNDHLCQQRHTQRNWPCKLVQRMSQIKTFIFWVLEFRYVEWKKKKKNQFYRYETPNSELRELAIFYFFQWQKKTSKGSELRTQTRNSELGTPNSELRTPELRNSLSLCPRQTHLASENNVDFVKSHKKGAVKTRFCL